MLMSSSRVAKQSAERRRHRPEHSVVHFFGWWLCLMHIFSGIAQCLTIIGIPVGIANFKIAAIALWPVGRRVVSVETARAAREANARRRFQ
jgi:uncharacterized membrane protein YccF (DUF307 family)